MKFAGLLLSALLIVLSCLPCADTGSGDVTGNRANSIADGHAGYPEKHIGHSEQDHNDLCSPFCICNCCGAQILSFTPSLSFSIQEDITAFISRPEMIHTSNFASMFSGSIWQPPQIV